MSEERATYNTSGYVDRFEEITQRMVALHNKKGADYGSGTDPYANVRASQDFGIPAWVGALVRLNDKITRLKSFIRNGNLQNESVEDSIRDIQVYAVIMEILYDEGKEMTVAEGAEQPSCPAAGVGGLPPCNCPLCIQAKYNQ